MTSELGLKPEVEMSRGRIGKGSHFLLARECLEHSVDSVTGESAAMEGLMRNAPGKVLVH